jgi:hypothetical protein
MQDQILTLVVDPANDSNNVNEAYRRYSSNELNRTLYIGPDHTTVMRNTLTLLRTPAKRNGRSFGVDKATFKFTQDVLVPTTTPDVDMVAPAIVEVAFSLPVGATPEDAMHLRQRAIAVLDNDTIVSPLHELLEI